MATLYTFEDAKPLSGSIKVIGVGDGGGNALNNMIEQNLQGVDFIVANTDAMAIEHSLAETKVLLGREIALGVGTGSNPEIGREAAEAECDHFRKLFRDTEILIIAAGLGGGTGTGAVPVVAEVAKGLGVLTVAIVTLPFDFEGKGRMQQAEAGIKELRKHVDSLIAIPNQKLLETGGERISMREAFKRADNKLLRAVKCLSDLITHTGYMNVDFADVKAVMSDTPGKTMIGSGMAIGKNRASKAAENVISSSFLKNVDIYGAQGVLVNVSGNEDMTLAEYDEAVSVIQHSVNEDADMICGMVYDKNLGDVISVSCVFTGIGEKLNKHVDQAVTGIADHVSSESDSVRLIVPAEMDEKEVASVIKHLSNAYRTISGDILIIESSNYVPPNQSKEERSPNQSKAARHG